MHATRLLHLRVVGANAGGPDSFVEPGAADDSPGSDRSNAPRAILATAMKGPLAHRGCFAVLAFALASCTSDAGASVESVAALDRALDSAKTDGKVVFLEFGATWCEPCKRLKATTLSDPRVTSWLGERALTLEIDIDQLPQLAAEFKVRSAPTMLFVRPDRTVLGRITGYRDPDAFLNEAERRIQGISATSEAERALAAQPRTPSRHRSLFSELVQDQRYAEAMEQAEAYWQSSRGSFLQMGGRVSFFLGEMEELAQSHLPAEKMLQRWLLEAKDALTEDGNAAVTAAWELATLAKRLQRTHLILEAASTTQSPPVLRALAAAAGDVLLADRRYAVLVDAGVCEPDRVRSQVGSMQLASLFGGSEAAALMRQYERQEVLVPFEALAGVGRESEALEIAKLILGQEDDAEVRRDLARAAERAGRPEFAARFLGPRLVR